ncbi:MAG: chloride channel protein [Acidimicrobiales bacterium]
MPPRLADFPPRFWAMVVLTGIGAGIGAIAFMGLLHAVQQAAFGYHTGEYSAAASRSSDLRRVVVLGAGGLVTGILLFALHKVAGGTGGEPTSVVWTGEGDVELVPTFASGAISEVSVGMGASIGREAAPQHAGAAVGAWLARRAGLTTTQRRVLIACGAGAGVGAVYNVPFAGGLFAAELYLGAVCLSTVVPALCTSLVATAVSWLTLPAEPLYRIPALASPSPSLLVWALLAGPVIGVAAGVYIRAIGVASDHRPTGRTLLVLPLLGTTAVGLIAIGYPFVLGNGRDLAQLAMTGGTGLVALAALSVLKPVATTVTLGSGVTGGLFTPTFSFGAVLGAFLGRSWSHLWPGPDPVSYAVIGAAAMLSAGMQAPLAAIAFTIELTSNSDRVMVAMLLTVAGAVLTCRQFEQRSVYSARLPEH